MIHVECIKSNNYPHDRKLLLFDRCAFQAISNDELLKLNEKYNVFCPRIFVMECLVPNREPKQRKILCERLRLIKNPIVIKGNTNIPPTIRIQPNSFYDVKFHTILTSREIARNCISSISISMERVSPEELISHYESRISDFKREMQMKSDVLDSNKAKLTISKIAEAQRFRQGPNNRIPSKEELKHMLEEDGLGYVTQELDYIAKEALKEIENGSVGQIIEYFTGFLHLTPRDVKKLRDRIIEEKRFTSKNYPDLAYPMYICYLEYFILCATIHNTKHLDQSAARDFEYLEYLNFCDRFIANESSTPEIVRSLLFDNISETPISTLAELKENLT